jgi:hypothetical protein
MRLAALHIIYAAPALRFGRKGPLMRLAALHIIYAAPALRFGRKGPLMRFAALHIYSQTIDREVCSQG